MLRRAQQTRNVGDSERGSLFGSVLGTKLEKVTRAQGLGTGDADRCDTRKKQFGNIFSGLSFLWMRREMERRKKKKLGLWAGGWLRKEGKGKKNHSIRERDSEERSQVRTSPAVAPTVRCTSVQPTRLLRKYHYYHTCSAAAAAAAATAGYGYGCGLRVDYCFYYCCYCCYHGVLLRTCSVLT